jgi:hypothetical protein
LYRPGSASAVDAPSEQVAAPIAAPTPDGNAQPVRPTSPVSRQEPAAVRPQPTATSIAPSPDFHGPWAGFLKSAKPSPKVVLTYMELGLDLGGQSDPRRRDVLKNLQAHLRWPAGTITFWPCSALHDNTLQPDSGMFWKGWDLWRTPTIACFGEEALRVILPDVDPAMSTHMLEHVIVYVLPPLARLTTMLPHEQQLAVDVLTKIRL